jgi:hypothetical protein
MASAVGTRPESRSVRVSKSEGSDQHLHNGYSGVICSLRRCSTKVEDHAKTNARYLFAAIPDSAACIGYAPGMCYYHRQVRAMRKPVHTCVTSGKRRPRRTFRMNRSAITSAAPQKTVRLRYRFSPPNFPLNLTRPDEHVIRGGSSWALAPVVLLTQPMGMH